MSELEVCVFTDDNWWDLLSENEFQTTFRMSRQSFTALQAELDYIANVDNEDTDVLLLTCLWVLGNTKPFDEAASFFSFDEGVEDIIISYLMKIMRLGDMYLCWPTEDEAVQIERGFASTFGFPGVVGVIGSLHIHIATSDDQSIYYNSEMKNNTIVLQVVCDNNLLLRNACAGCPGSSSIEAILKTSPLYQKLADEEGFLMKKNKHLLGGTQHPQMKTLLTPYKGDDLTKYQRKFNELHSVVMYTGERTFKCLENRFPRLTSVDTLCPKLATLLVSAICVLHNFTRVRNDCCELYL